MLAPGEPEVVDREAKAADLNARHKSNGVTNGWGDSPLRPTSKKFRGNYDKIDWSKK